MSSRIIVADNHTVFRSALSKLLRAHSGWEVVAEVADGREAVNCCRRLRPDLVVMDVRMPEVDGLEATRAIKRDSPGTVVLMLNGYAGDPRLLADALEAGASGYILKSAAPQQITDAVCKVLEGTPLVDQEIAAQLLLRLLSKPSREPPSPLGPNPPPSEKLASVALPATLTRREVEVLQLVARGCTNRQIARSLFISVTTVKKHVQRLISKLGVSTRTQAAVKANGLGLLGGREEG
jgi:DNA-binding NarL/FixJ family response regulator